MTGDKKISKNGINNIFTTARILSRTEAYRKYRQLSSETREDADDLINDRFYLVTGFPKNVKLDPNNPEHKNYVEEWLKQRDIVMGWNRDWDTAKGQEQIPKYFSEKTAPTPKSQLEKAEGIFEQRMSGSAFKKFVDNRLEEVYAYTSHTARSIVGRRTFESKIAERLATKLVNNELWLKNALETMDGRDALRKILYRLPNTSENRGIMQKLRASLEPFKNERRFDSIANLAQFNMLYPRLETHIKKNLEAEGYTVEKIYMKEFTPDSLEIRASVTRKDTVETGTYGYRSDPYVKNVKTVKNDINVGGFEYSSGRFLNHSHFAKHGTAQTDWDTQLAIGALAVKAGVGIRAAVSEIGTVIINRKAVSKTLKEIGEEVTERSVRVKLTDPAFRDTVPISMDDTIPISKSNSVLIPKSDTLPRVKVPSETPILKGVGELEPPVKGLSETIPPIGGRAPVKGQVETVPPRSGLTETVPPISKPTHLKPKSSKPEIPDPQKLESVIVVKIKKSATISDEIADELGEDLSRKLYSDGFSTEFLSKRIKSLKKQGKTSDEIKSFMNDQHKVFEYIRDHYFYPKNLKTTSLKAIKEDRVLNANDKTEALGKAHKEAHAEIITVEENLKEAISGLEFEKMVSALDNPDTVMGSKGLLALNLKADRKAAEILKKLGVSLESASLFYLGTKNQQKETKNQPKDQIKIKEKQKTTNKRSNLREKGVF